MLGSNDPDFEIERTIDFPMPIIYGASNPDGAHVVFIGSGSPGESFSDPADDVKPKVFIVSLADYTVPFDRDLNTVSLDGYIGQHPMFAGISRNFYCYVATPDALLRIDTKSWGQILDWLFGPYRVVGVDYFTDLVYAVPADDPTRVDRITLEEETLPQFTMPEPVNGILFISTSTLQ